MSRPQAVPRLWDNPKWMQYAACISEGDPDWWFPEKDGGPLTALETLMAQRICTACPVQNECRLYAYQHQERGIWGGLTEQQRAPRKPTTGRHHVCSLSSSA
jgi:WhiB family transcriptional regulator, redox-sensing transcriptional regulator